MYRSGTDYDRMAKLVIDIYCDYGFSAFPIDERLVCSKLGIALVPYSSFQEADSEVFRKRSEYGFLCLRGTANMPTIFYNDGLSSSGAIRLTIFHEIKHYVCEDTDEDPEDDDLADYFGKFFACPIPYLIIKRICDPLEIISKFDVSYTVAEHLARNYRNRTAKYGYRIFDYEKPLIELLDSDYYHMYLEGGGAI